ncbi:MAG: hypothetical protein OXC40_04360 [Proteobacteria bacterium]|nr:hypothetical protein [Pseudomonadota bacterium]
MILIKRMLPNLWLVFIMVVGTFLYGCATEKATSDDQQDQSQDQNNETGDPNKTDNTDQKQPGLDGVVYSSAKFTYSATGGGEMTLITSSDDTDDTTDTSSAIDDDVGSHSHHCNYAVNPQLGTSTGDGKTMLVKVSGDTVKISGVNFAMNFLFNALKEITDATARDEAEVHLVCAERAPDAGGVFTANDPTLSGDALQFLINLYVDSVDPSLTDEEIRGMRGFGTASESAFIEQITTLVQSLSSE